MKLTEPAPVLGAAKKEIYRDAKVLLQLGPKGPI
jgi:hypothetical protein